MNYYIGIDIGTYETKGVLVASNGELIATHKKPHQLIIPQSGWAEHDAKQVWWQSVKEIIQFFMTYCQRQHIAKETVTCIGLSSIAPSIVPVDSQGEPLRNAILYGIDTRTTPQIDSLNATFGEQELLANSKQALTTQAGGPKILWIKENEPSIYEKTDVFLSGTGFAVYQLTKQKVIDHYTAASFAPLYDFTHHQWNEKYVNAVTEMDKLPSISWTTDIVGNVTKEVAAELGLSEATQVITGTTDALSEAISSGVVRQNDLMLMFGSSTFFILNTKELVQSDKMWPNLHAIPNMYSITGGTATAGSLTRWFIDQFEDHELPTDERYERLAAQGTTSSVCANGVICLPYFSGERTPINNPKAKGMFFGLSLKTTKLDLYRAMLEGIGFSIRQNIDYMKTLGFTIDRMISIGGGTKNKLLLQIVSDICGIQQVLMKNTMGASYGNAFLCGLAVGDYESLQSIEEWLEIDTVIEPCKDANELYNSKFLDYCELYRSTKHLM